MRILIVDDSPDMLMMTKHHTVKFFGESAVIDEAGDGDEGLRMGLENKYDLIITDYVMPNLNGEDMAIILRDRGSTIPIILVSSDLQQVKDPLNFDDLLLKSDLCKLPEVFSFLMGDL